MRNNDLHSSIKQAVSILPTVLGATGAIAGAIHDRQGYGGVEFLLGYGSITTTGTVVTAVVKEGDVTGSLASVADVDLLGTEALASLPAATPRTAGTTKEVVKRIGYKGTKRYVQVTLVGSGVTSAASVWADAVMHNPEVAPVSNP